MRYESLAKNHEAAASREAEAATRAACEESARNHLALSMKHRAEAAKLNAVHTVLRVAFED